LRGKSNSQVLGVSEVGDFFPEEGALGGGELSRRLPNLDHLKGLVRGQGILHLSELNYCVKDLGISCIRSKGGQLLPATGQGKFCCQIDGLLGRRLRGPRGSHLLNPGRIDGAGRGAMPGRGFCHPKKPRFADLSTTTTGKKVGKKKALKGKFWQHAIQKK